MKNVRRDLVRFTACRAGDSQIVWELFLHAPLDLVGLSSGRALAVTTDPRHIALESADDHGGVVAEHDIDAIRGGPLSIAQGVVDREDPQADPRFSAVRAETRTSQRPVDADSARPRA